MDFLRLPSALRRSILQDSHTLRRLLSTAIAQDVSRNAASIPSENDSPPNPKTTADGEPSLGLTLSPSTLNTYTTTEPPSPLHLRQANAFFQRHDPTLLYTAARFLSLPPTPNPEICVLGRSNVGKSSLLNALFGRTRLALAKVSKKPGKTRTINGYGVGGDGTAAKKGLNAWKSFGRGGIVVVDMPGYGKGSREDWGKEIMKYIESRKQLRRTYVLVDTEHGLKSADLSLLLHLRGQGIPYQIVMSKVDKVVFPKPKYPSPSKLSQALVQLRGLRKKVSGTLNKAAAKAGVRSDVVENILCCSGNPDKILDRAGRRRMIGVDELRWDMLMACGMGGSNKLELGRHVKAKLQAEEDMKVRDGELEKADSD